MRGAPFSQYLPEPWSCEMVKHGGWIDAPPARDRLLYELVTEVRPLLCPNVLHLTLGRYYPDVGQLMADGEDLQLIAWDMVLPPSPERFPLRWDSSNRYELRGNSAEQINEGIAEVVASVEQTANAPYGVYQAVADSSSCFVETIERELVLEFGAGELTFPMFELDGRPCISVPPPDRPMRPPLAFIFRQDPQMAVVLMSVHWSRWLQYSTPEFLMTQAFIARMRDRGWETTFSDYKVFD